jgi:hypothetical protein
VTAPRLVLALTTRTKYKVYFVKAGQAAYVGRRITRRKSGDPRRDARFPRQGVAGASKLVAHAGKFILRKASLWLRISIPLVTERLGQGARASVRSAFS